MKRRYTLKDAQIAHLNKHNYYLQFEVDDYIHSIPISEEIYTLVANANEEDETNE